MSKPADVGLDYISVIISIIIVLSLLHISPSAGFRQYIKLMDFSLLILDYYEFKVLYRSWKVFTVLIYPISGLSRKNIL